MNRNKRYNKVNMILRTIILGMTILASNACFAQQQQQQRQPLTEQLLKKYMDLPEKQRIAENKRFLEMYKDVRVADVRDAMDWFGYMNYGSVDPGVRPLFRTLATGIARTARYLPYVGPNVLERDKEYTRWQGLFYRDICTYPWQDVIEDGDFMAIDVSGVNVGLLGSANTLQHKLKGLRGYVINGSGVRDTDECVLQKIPIWSHFIGQAMVQGRIQFEATQVPVNIGGVTVFPGDIIVADGDGVIVVPRGVAETVAKHALFMLKDDMDGRKSLYQRLGWELDQTVIR